LVPTFSSTEHTATSARHTTGYLASGADDAPLLIFVHDWPELSLSWRHQLPVFAALGFRCIAPDMRGYGRSSTYRRHEDFAQEAIVSDMLELLASLGGERGVWIDHDWGAPVVWNLAAHHPEQAIGVVILSVPYLAAGFTLENVLRDREESRGSCSGALPTTTNAVSQMSQLKESSGAARCAFTENCLNWLEIV
jgi:pimeloyl-ACP methyl ester carboxylesterase